ncbi:MAG: hypothetical protein ABFR90_03145 [Planctomycetota bacterium]
MIGRLIRNSIVALLSSSWVIFLIMTIAEFFSYLVKTESIDGASFDLIMIESFIRITFVWLWLVLFFWTFVLTNLIWPIHKKTKKLEN